MWSRLRYTVFIILCLFFQSCTLYEVKNISMEPTLREGDVLIGVRIPHNVSIENLRGRIVISNFPIVGDEELFLGGFELPAGDAGMPASMSNDINMLSVKPQERLSLNYLGRKTELSVFVDAWYQYVYGQHRAAGSLRIIFCISSGGISLTSASSTVLSSSAVSGRYSFNSTMLFRP